MAHVITRRCIDEKDQSCVAVCPVDCIHPSSDMDDPAEFELAPQLYIDPDVCIDCGACIPECPVEAIFYIGDLSEEFADSIETNRLFYQNRQA
jgi:NAD-dependent dihydropyrimidine dehydrogenase PreA subunit